MVKTYYTLNSNNYLLSDQKKNIAPVPYNSVVEHFFEGEQGSIGEPGPRGLRGDRGLRGPEGPAGPSGPKGDGLNEQDMEARTLWCRDENNCATPNDIVARFRQDAYIQVGPNSNGGKSLIVGGNDRAPTGEPNIYTKNNNLYLDGGSTYMGSNNTDPGYTYINFDNKGKTFINPNGTHTLLNDKDGFVGVNMNGIDPQNNFHIRGDQPVTVENIGDRGTAGIIFKASSDTTEGGQNWTVGANDLGLFMYDNNLERYSITTKEGSVGIGTQLPNKNFTLDVDGHGRYRQDIRMSGGPGASVQVNWNKLEGERSDWIKYFTKQDLGNLTREDLIVDNYFRNSITGETFLIRELLPNTDELRALNLVTKIETTLKINEILDSPDTFEDIKIGDVKECQVNQGLELMGGDNSRSKINFFGNEMDIQYGPLNKVLINFDRFGVNFMGPVKFQDVVSFNGPMERDKDPNKPNYSFKVLEDTLFEGNNYNKGISYWGTKDDGSLDTVWTRIQSNMIQTNNGVRLYDQKDSTNTKFADINYNSEANINEGREVQGINISNGAFIMNSNLIVEGPNEGNQTTKGIEAPLLKSALLESDVIRTSGAIQYSDKRLKENINKINQNDNISNLLKMQGYNYKNKTTNENDIGLIAQEIENIDSNLVDNSGKYKGIKYNNIIPMLVEAVKFQQNEINKLKTKL